MSGYPVYVAAPYSRAPEVRAIHDELHARGCQPVSHWARLARGLDMCATMTPSELASVNELNDACLEKAAAVIALTFEGEGGEMFCEVERARVAGIPVLWTGPRFVPTCARTGVYVVSLARALDALAYVANVMGRPNARLSARLRLHRFLLIDSEARVRCA